MCAKPSVSRYNDTLTEGRSIVENTTNDQKLSKFIQAITAYAEEQSDAIHREVEAFKEARLGRAEQEVLRESYVLIQHEQDEMRRQIARELSAQETAARHALFSKRREMMDAIFDRARQKLLDYAQTAEYQEDVKASFAAMVGELPAEGTVYAVCARDEALMAELTPLCPEGSRIEVAEDITLGGLRGTNVAAGILLDDTLDTRLEQQHDWFTDHSGLTIE